MTIETITIKFDDKGDCISHTFIMLKDFDPMKEFLEFKKDNYNENNPFSGYDFIEHLTINGFISNFMYNKTFEIYGALV